MSDRPTTLTDALKDATEEIEDLKAEVERLRAEVERLEAARDMVAEEREAWKAEAMRLREVRDAAQALIHGKHAYVHGDCEHSRPLEAALAALDKPSHAV